MTSLFSKGGEGILEVTSTYKDHRTPHNSGCKDQGTPHNTVEDVWEEPRWCVEKLREHLKRRRVAAEVSETRLGCRRVRYRLPENPPLISIIVPTRDAVGLLRQCVESVLGKTTYSRFELLMVDNQSVDPDALAYFGELGGRSSVRVLRYDRPFNYSAINNFAAKEARGEVLCLLNNDTEVISPDWLEEMVGHLLQDRVGAVGARLLYADGRVQHGGVTVGPGGCADHLHAELPRSHPGYCQRAVIAQELSAVTAACMLTWKHVYDQVGGFDGKNLPVAFNDVDYCLRLQDAGYRVIYTPHAELYHHEWGTRGVDTTRRQRWRARREINYMRRRWRERMKHDPYYNPNLSYDQPNFTLNWKPRIKKPWER
jgi:GT2 family glycosyltransferase